MTTDKKVTAPKHVVSGNDGVTDQNRIEYEAVRAGNHGDTEFSARDMHDRAYSRLKMLIDDIRAYGKYAFRNDREHRKKYLFYHPGRSGKKTETDSGSRKEVEVPLDTNAA